MTQESVARFQRLLGESIALSPIATVVTDPNLPDNPIILMNQAFEDLTGYTPSDAIGRNCRFLGGEGTDPRHRAQLRDAIEDARPSLTELVNYRKDGSPFLNAVMIAPVREQDGTVAFFLGSQMDVGPLELERSLRARDAAWRLSTLTPRQSQVLEGLKDGLLNKQIAARLDINETTVKMHRAALLRRLNAKCTADALRIALDGQ